MASPVALSALIARIRFEADMVNSTRATDAQITTLVNTHFAELYDRLVAAGPSDYYLATTTLTTIAGTTAYALPADFRSLLGVFLNDTATRRREVRPLQEGLRSAYDAPQAAVSLTVEYVPTAPVVAVGTDTLDSVSGWDELIVQLCARALLRRERRDVSAFDRSVAEARERVMSSAPKRNQDGPRFINDVEACESYPLYGIETSVNAYRLAGGNLHLYSIALIYP